MNTLNAKVTNRKARKEMKGRVSKAFRTLVSVLLVLAFTPITPITAFAGESSVQTTYAITVTAGTGGTISPTGDVNVAAGASQAFAIAADADYSVADVIVDGVSVGARSAYTFKDVRANHTIEASFAASAQEATPAKAASNEQVSTQAQANEPAVQTLGVASAVPVTVDGVNIYANGVPITITQNATAGIDIAWRAGTGYEAGSITYSGTDANIFGGSKDASVASTSVTLTSGTVANIFGGGSTTDSVGTFEAIGQYANAVNAWIAKGSIVADKPNPATYSLNNVTNVANVTVAGGTISGAVYGGPQGYGVVTTATTNISGGTMVNAFASGSNGYTQSGTLNISGGSITSTTEAVCGINRGYMQTADINVTGGTIASFNLGQGDIGTTDVGAILGTAAVSVSGTGVSLPAGQSYVGSGIAGAVLVKGTTLIAASQWNANGTAETTGVTVPSGKTWSLDKSTLSVPSGITFEIGGTLTGTNSSALTRADSSATIIREESGSLSGVGTFFEITSSAGEGGTISPAGTVVVPSGESQAFTATATAEGNAFRSFTVDGTTALANPYTFTNVTAAHTIAANFGTPGDWYVDETAADGGTGTAAAPFKTIPEAVTAASAGDTIHISSGAYTLAWPSVDTANEECVALTIDKSLTFIGEGESATSIHPASKKPDGTSYSNAYRLIKVTSGASLTLKNLTLDGCLVGGTSVDNNVGLRTGIYAGEPNAQLIAENVTVQNTIYNGNNGDAIIIGGANTNSSLTNVTLSNFRNAVRIRTDSALVGDQNKSTVTINGIYIDGGNTLIPTTLTNGICLFNDFATTEIDVDVQHAYITNNSYNTSEWQGVGIAIWGDGGPTNLKVGNSYIANCAVGCEYQQSGERTTYDTNEFTNVAFKNCSEGIKANDMSTDGSTFKVDTCTFDTYSEWAILNNTSAGGLVKIIDNSVASNMGNRFKTIVSGLNNVGTTSQTFQTSGTGFSETYTFDADQAVNAGETLLIDAYSAITVPAGKTLTNNGKITVGYESSLTVNGGYAGSGVVELKTGSSFTNNSGTDITVTHNGVNQTVASGSTFSTVIKLNHGGVWSEYETLDAAILAAADGDTVYLSDDVATASTITLNKSITIKGNGKTLYCADSTVPVLSVSATGVTLDGIVFAGGSNALSVASGGTAKVRHCDFSDSLLNSKYNPAITDGSNPCDAMYCYWGTSTPGTNVTKDPYYTDAAMTTLSGGLGSESDNIFKNYSETMTAEQVATAVQYLQTASQATKDEIAGNPAEMTKILSLAEKYNINNSSIGDTTVTEAGTVSTDLGSVAADGAVLSVPIVDGATSNAQLVITKNDAPGVLPFASQKVFAYDFHLNIVSKNTTTQVETITYDVQPTAPIKITMNVPSGIDADNVILALYHSGSATEVLTVGNGITLSGDKTQMSFVMSKFSTVLVGEGNDIEITTEPVDTNVVYGNGATLSVAAISNGGNALSYQWYQTFDRTAAGIELTGETGTVLSISAESLQPNTIYYYYCRVSNLSGANVVASDHAAVTVMENQALAITTQPKDSSFESGTTPAALTVEATATPTAAITYQWYVDGSAVSGATDSSFNPKDVSNGQHSCYVAVSANDVTVNSNTVTITKYVPGTIVIDPATPADTFVKVGNPNSKTLQVNAKINGSTDGLTYQWYACFDSSKRGSSAVSGATNATFNIPTDLLKDTDYYYYCAVSKNGVGGVDSRVAKVKVVGSVVPNVALASDSTVNTMHPFGAADTHTDSDTVTVTTTSGDPAWTYAASNFTLSSSATDKSQFIDGLSITGISDTGFPDTGTITVQATKAVTATSAELWFTYHDGEGISHDVHVGTIAINNKIDPESTFYVNNAIGDDTTGNGTSKYPYKTLEKASTAVKAVSGYPGGSYKIVLQAAEATYEHVGGKGFSLPNATTLEISNGAKISEKGYLTIPGSSRIDALSGAAISLDSTNVVASGWVRVYKGAKASRAGTLFIGDAESNAAYEFAATSSDKDYAGIMSQTVDGVSAYRTLINLNGDFSITKSQTFEPGDRLFAEGSADDYANVIVKEGVTLSFAKDVNARAQFSIDHADVTLDGAIHAYSVDDRGEWSGQVTIWGNGTLDVTSKGSIQLSADNIAEGAMVPTIENYGTLKYVDKKNLNFQGQLNNYPGSSIYENDAQILGSTNAALSQLTAGKLAITNATKAAGPFGYALENDGDTFGNFNVTGTMGLAEDEVFYVSTGATVNIANGGAFNVASGSIIDNSGTVNVHGALSTAATTALTSAGAYKVFQDGTLAVGAMNLIDSAGIVQVSGSLGAPDNYVQFSENPVEGETSGTSLYVPASSIMTIAKPNITAGTFANKFLIGSNDEVTVDGKLVVNNGTAVVNRGSMLVNGTLSVDGANSILQGYSYSGAPSDNAFISFGSNANVSLTNGGTATGLVADKVAGKNYKWQPSASGFGGTWAERIAINTTTNVEYTNLQYALDQAADEQVIKMLVDYTLPDDGTTANDLTVPEKKTLEVPKNLTLTVGANKTFTVDNGATLTVNGTLDVAGSYELAVASTNPALAAATISGFGDVKAEEGSRFTGNATATPWVMEIEGSPYIFAGGTPLTITKNTAEDAGNYGCVATYKDFNGNDVIIATTTEITAPVSFYGGLNGAYLGHGTSITVKSGIVGNTYGGGFGKAYVASANVEIVGTTSEKPTLGKVLAGGQAKASDTSNVVEIASVHIEYANVQVASAGAGTNGSVGESTLTIGDGATVDEVSGSGDTNSTVNSATINIGGDANQASPSNVKKLFGANRGTALNVTMNISKYNGTIGESSLGAATSSKDTTGKITNSVTYAVADGNTTLGPLYYGKNDSLAEAKTITVTGATLIAVTGTEDYTDSEKNYQANGANKSVVVENGTTLVIGTGAVLYVKEFFEGGVNTRNAMAIHGTLRVVDTMAINNGIYAYVDVYDDGQLQVGVKNPVNYINGTGGMLMVDTPATAATNYVSIARNTANSGTFLQIPAGNSATISAPNSLITGYENYFGIGVDDYVLVDGTLNMGANTINRGQINVHSSGKINVNKDSSLIGLADTEGAPTKLAVVSFRENATITGEGTAPGLLGEGAASVSGKNFKWQPSTLAGASLTDGTWIQAKIVNENTGLLYTNLTAALSAATSGQSLRLLDNYALDPVLDATATIPEGVTLKTYDTILEDSTLFTLTTITGQNAEMPLAVKGTIMVKETSQLKNVSADDSMVHEGSYDFYPTAKLIVDGHEYIGTGGSVVVTAAQGATQPFISVYEVPVAGQTSTMRVWVHSRVTLAISGTNCPSGTFQGKFYLGENDFIVVDDGGTLLVGSNMTFVNRGVVSMWGGSTLQIDGSFVGYCDKETASTGIPGLLTVGDDKGGKGATVTINGTAPGLESGSGQNGIYLWEPDNRTQTSFSGTWKSAVVFNGDSGNFYATIAEAIKMAAAGDELLMVKPVTLTEDLVIDKSLTFTSGSATNGITVSNGATLSVASGAAVDLSKVPLTIDAGAKLAIGKNATLAYSGATLSANGAIENEGTLQNGGTMVLNGTFTNKGSYVQTKDGTLSPQLTITEQPQNLSLVKGSSGGVLSVVGSVVWANDDGYTYQWQKNTGTEANPVWTDIEGATNYEYAVPTDAEGTFQYRCIVTAEGASSATSNAATVTVKAASTNNTSATTGKTTASGGSTKSAVTADGHWDAMLFASLVCLVAASALLIAVCALRRKGHANETKSASRKQ